MSKAKAIAGYSLLLLGCLLLFVLLFVVNTAPMP